MAAWIKMPLGMELGLSPDDFVLDGNPLYPPQKGGRAPSPIFGPLLLWPNGCNACIKMPLGMEVGLSPGNFVFGGEWGPSYPRNRRHTHHHPVLTAGWMKTPRGAEVDLGPGHIVLDGVPALRETGTAPPPIFSARVYCGHTVAHLSYCTNGRPKNGTENSDNSNHYRHLLLHGIFFCSALNIN